MQPPLHRPDDSTPAPKGPDYLLEVWRRRRGLGTFIAAAALACTLGAVVSLPNLYQASATVIVDRQEVSEAFVRAAVTAELETRIQTIHQRVTSRARLSELITKLNLYPGMRKVAPIDAVIDRMRNDIQLHLKGVDQPNGRTTTVSFTLTYSGSDRTKVATVANALANLYVGENTATRERQAVRTAEVLAQQVTVAKADLDGRDQRTTAFTTQYSEELPAQLSTNLAALQRLNDQLRTNGDRQLRAIERRERIETMPPETAPAARVDAEPTPQMRLATLRRELFDLQRTYGDQYPDVLRTKADIATLEREIGIVPQPGGGPPAPPPKTEEQLRRQAAIAETVREVEGLKIEEKRLRLEIDALQARVEHTPERQRGLDALTQGLEAAKERYATLVKQNSDAQLASHLEQQQDLEQFRVLDPAVPPASPTAPNRPWIAFAGLMASLGLGLVGIVVAERMDMTVHNADDLKAFGDVPLLATIQQINTPRTTRRARWRKAAITGAVLVALALLGAGAYYAAAGNEQFVRLTVRGSV